MVSHGVQRGAAGSAVTRLGSHKIWPLAVEACVSLGHHPPGFVVGREEVDEHQHEIPGKDGGGGGKLFDLGDYGSHFLSAW